MAIGIHIKRHLKEKSIRELQAKDVERPYREFEFRQKIRALRNKIRADKKEQASDETE